MAIDIRYRNGMDQKNTADLIPVVDIVDLSTLDPNFFTPFFLILPSTGCFPLVTQTFNSKKFKRFENFPKSFIRNK